MRMMYANEKITYNIEEFNRNMMKRTEKVLYEVNSEYYVKSTHLSLISSHFTPGLTYEKFESECTDDYRAKRTTTPFI